MGQVINFEECIIAFQVLVYKQMLSFLRVYYISFSKPQLNFQKIKMSRILLSINLNVGCSSHEEDVLSKEIVEFLVPCLITGW